MSANRIPEPDWRESRHPDGWAPSQIAAIGEKLRGWFDRHDPDISRQLFNSDIEDMVMLVWPYAYQAGRDDELAAWSER